VSAISGEGEDDRQISSLASGEDSVGDQGLDMRATVQSPDETQPSDSDDGLWLSAFALETAGLVQMQGENAGVQVAVSMTPREADQLAKLLTEAAQQVVDAADDGREQAVEHRSAGCGAEGHPRPAGAGVAMSRETVSECHIAETPQDSPWRVGRKVGRTIYVLIGGAPSDEDELIGVMDSMAVAAAAVDGHNATLSPWSKCCGFPVTVGGGDPDEGTAYHICSACEVPCDAVYAEVTGG
jgi:hypothetical protein